MFKINPEKLKSKRISEATTYLQSTDWIVSKLNEASLLGDDVQPLLTQYEDELSKRAEARALINELGG